MRRIERHLGIASCAIEMEHIVFPKENTKDVAMGIFFYFFVKNIMMLFRCGHVFQKGSFPLFFPATEEWKEMVSLGNGWSSWTMSTSSSLCWRRKAEVIKYFNKKQHVWRGRKWQYILVKVVKKKQWQKIWASANQIKLYSVCKLTFEATQALI